MLKQFVQLSLDADGRYATDQELKFCKDYLESVEKRVTVYEKVRDQEEAIIHRWEAAKRSQPDDLFHVGEHDITQICRRDQTDLLRFAALAMLMNDLDRLREGILIWYQTIVRSFGYQWYAKTNYHLIQDVIKLYLEAEEVAMILPAFQLEHAILGA